MRRFAARFVRVFPIAARAHLPARVHVRVLLAIGATTVISAIRVALWIRPTAVFSGREPAAAAQCREGAALAIAIAMCTRMGGRGVGGRCGGEAEAAQQLRNGADHE